MDLFATRILSGWIITTDDQRFVGYDGQITKFPERAYTTTLLTRLIEMYGRVSYNGWRLNFDNFIRVNVPDFNNPNLRDEDMPLYNIFVRVIGNSIFAVNAYNGVILNAQEVVDQINIIAGNPQEVILRTVAIAISNRTVTERLIRHLVSQVEGEPIVNENFDDAQRAAVFSNVIELLSFDSIIREGVQLSVDKLNELATDIYMPIIGNRSLDDFSWLDILRTVKACIIHISTFWE